jgi:1-pyrroline-5-carboxylate dehydrogenase
MSQKITYVTLLADERIHPEYEKALKEVEKEFGNHYPLYVGDNEIYTGEEFEKRSPINTDILMGYFQKANRENIKEAIATAKEAFKEWSSMHYTERIKIFRKVADIIEKKRFEIAAYITYESGKNRMEALAEVHEAIDAIRYYCDVYEKNEGYNIKMNVVVEGEIPYAVAKPYGVWVVISPFNFPFMLANGMCLGALLTGNTVVFKPTSEAPFGGLLLYKYYREGGVIAGAINYLTGPGPVFEDEIVTNPDVAGIAFTGSRAVGMRLYKRFTSAQPYPKPIVLEMGSKNPTIVSNKADLDKAVEGIVRAAFGYNGQKCSATSRVYVHKDVKDEFLRKLVERTKKIVVGDPRKREVFMGPVINKTALENFKKYIEDAKNIGGKILYGGNVLTEGEYSKGFYVEPTIITDIPRDYYLMKEELFLPILIVDTVNNLEEAIQEANNTEYGLTAGIFSEDEKEIKYFFDNIQFGVCYANRRGGSTTGAWPSSQTFVGWKGSGCTGKGVGGPHYLLTFIREQSQTIVK